MRGQGYSEKEVSDSYAFYCVDNFWQVGDLNSRYATMLSKIPRGSSMGTVKRDLRSVYSGQMLMLADIHDFIRQLWID